MTNRIHDGNCITEDHDIMTRVIKSDPKDINHASVHALNARTTWPEQQTYDRMTATNITHACPAHSPRLATEMVELSLA
jgi:hypothetical protein